LAGQTINGELTRVAGYEHVGSLQTFDLNLGYTLPEDWISGSQVSLNINNVLDKPPPFFNNSSGFTNGSQIGRTISIGIVKKW
jgi:iron complex outermembrane receptor protein